MKTKNENHKFNLEKFELAKLTNPKSIVGGDTGSGDVCTTTDGDGGSSERCNTTRPKDKTTTTTGTGTGSGPANLG